MADKESNLKVLTLGSHQVALAVERHPRARRLTLRLEPASGRIHLVLPRRVALAEGLDFARSRKGWILKQLDSLPPQVPFVEGAEIPYLGDAHRIAHWPDARGGVWREDGEIRVTGFVEHLPRRVADFLKMEARRELGVRAQEKAARVERRVTKLALRDTHSRWGSCARDGRINFSWRLILAPEAVLDYVVAHEVAHLVHMNHSREFWRVVDRLTDDVQGAKLWLKRNGASLLRYGGSASPHAS